MLAPITAVPRPDRTRYFCRLVEPAFTLPCRSERHCDNVCGRRSIDYCASGDNGLGAPFGKRKSGLVLE